MSWPLILLTPTGEADHALRRFTYGDAACPALAGGHSASVPVGSAPLVRGPDGMREPVAIPDRDPRWPAACVCGYAFAPRDGRVIDIDERFALPDGRIVSTRPVGSAHDAAPVGSLWVVPWITAEDDWVGPDGRCLMLRLPDGHDWMIDGPATSGGRWTRTGDIPRITAHPSILSPGYHGWLNDGVLSDDLEGRTYPPMGEPR